MPDFKDSTPFFKKIRYRLEAPFVGFGMKFFRYFSVHKASDIASVIARFVGKKISVNKLAYKNLSSALPYLSLIKKREIIDGMWDNLGRVIGEFPHICTMRTEKIMEFAKFDKESEERVEKMKSLKNGGIIFSGHIGNWEIGPKMLIAKGFEINVVYRPLNNPLVESKTAALRGLKMIEKSQSGSRKIISALRRGEFVIILADQRTSDGSVLKFFNRNALTTTSIARLAIKHQVPIIPAYVLRIDRQFKFIGHIEEFIEVSDYKQQDSSLEKTQLHLERSDTELSKKVIEITKKINQRLENWIEENPSQWFWVHDRWKM